MFSHSEQLYHISVHSLSTSLFVSKECSHAPHANDQNRPTASLLAHFQTLATLQ
jgi:hypothetical protein